MLKMKVKPNTFLLRFSSVLIFVSLFFISLNVSTLAFTQEPPKIVQLKIYEDFENDALLYEAKGKHALVLVHQSGYRKESWDDLARNFQLKHITSLSLERSTAEDVGAATQYLIRKGYRKITLIGASVGGSAVLQALSKNAPKQVQAAVLMAPSYGPALKDSRIRKLVIVTSKDFYGRYARDVFKEAEQPKRLVEYTGRKHAQELFKSAHSEKVTDLIYQFITQE